MEESRNCRHRAWEGYKSMQIDMVTKALWAKKSIRDDKPVWLPLIWHLRDTMDVCSFLWDHWLGAGQKNDIIAGIKDGNEYLAETLVRFLGGIHDIGKATPAFQTQKGYNNTADLDAQLVDNLEMAGFTGISDFDIRFAGYTHHSLAGEVILQEMGVNKGVSSIIGAHHGRPVGSEGVCQDQMSAYRANYYQTEKLSDVSAIWKEAREYIFDWAIKESGFTSRDDIPELSQPSQVLLSGLLIMADWIASNENYFPLIPVEDIDVKDPDRRFGEGIRKWYTVDHVEFTAPGTCGEFYLNRFGFLPRDFQRVIYDRISTIRDPGIIIIEAPMGGGKTEAALAAAEQLAAKTGRSGLFFGLPTQATSNGMFPRVESWLEKVSESYGKRLSIQLKHGKAALNPMMQKLSFKGNVDDDEKDGSVVVNQWFLGRKTSALDDFVVGTVDQFLLASLKQKHLALRHLGFDRKVVIIDEVHAYDAYMQQYLAESIRWMGAYGVPVVLLSATLPAKKREELVVEYLRGKGFKKRDMDMTRADLSTDGYPLMTYTDGKRVDQETDFPREEDKPVEIKRLSDEDLYDKISGLIDGGGIVGVIVNTVKRSQEIAERCIKRFGEEKVILLHSEFIATDRIDKEKRLLELIGKGARRPEKLIVIGTQVIEQSLDIDFDVLITDLCPMDLLMQRIGRLHRHDIRRPDMHKKAVTYVLGYSDSLDFNSGSSAVYGDYLLAKTQYYLPDKVMIPSMISPLVQKVYDTGCDPIFPGEYQKKYDESKEKFHKDIESKEQRAKAFRIDGPKKRIDTEKYNLIGWLNTMDTSSSEEESYAQVRDTNETVEIIAVKRNVDKYGMFSPKNGMEKLISDHIHEAEMAKELAGQTIRLPLSVTYGKDGGISTLIEELEEYNSRHLAEWQDEPWLMGQLGLIFDEDGSFTLGKIHMKYNSKTGLITERVK